MSGKAPPTGPRALLGSMAASSVASSSSSSTSHQGSQSLQPTRPQAATVTLAQNKRIGATPPTGPRSLINGAHARPPPPGPKSLLNNGHTGHLNSSAANSSLPNGLNAHALQSNRHPISIKGKKPETGSGVGVNLFFHTSLVHNRLMSRFLARAGSPQILKQMVSTNLV